MYIVSHKRVVKVAQQTATNSKLIVCPLLSTTFYLYFPLNGSYVISIVVPVDYLTSTNLTILCKFIFSKTSNSFTACLVLFTIQTVFVLKKSHIDSRHTSLYLT
uniref:Uncharacterized protein n=1 Tax=Glossina brevipalpis TaxID=37001 RepID=A0A1A9WWE2_9MUSC